MALSSSESSAGSIDRFQFVIYIFIGPYGWVGCCYCSSQRFLLVKSRGVGESTSSFLEYRMVGSEVCPRFFVA